MSKLTGETINLPHHQIIMDGGESLPGAPKSWDAAREWEDKVNTNKNSFTEPIWSWDCFFKLNFDGPLLHVESRFYPPAEQYGPRWDGSVWVMFLDKKIAEKSFEEDTLYALKERVEEYVNSITRRISKNLLSLFKEKHD